MEELSAVFGHAQGLWSHQFWLWHLHVGTVRVDPSSGVVDHEGIWVCIAVARAACILRCGCLDLEQIFVNGISKDLIGCLSAVHLCVENLIDLCNSCQCDKVHHD